MAIWNITHGVLTITENGGSSLTFTFDGEFQVNIPGRTITFAKDRGALPATPVPIRGEQNSMTGSFKAKIQQITNASSDNVNDLILAETGAGNVGSGWTSTTGGATSPYMGVNLDYTDGVDVMRFPDSNLRGNFAELLEGNEMNFTFECPHAYPTLNP